MGASFVLFARHVKIMNVVTGEIHNFSSIKKTCTFIGCKDQKPIRTRLSGYNSDKPYHGYFIKNESDESPWPNLIKVRVIRHWPARIILQNVRSGEIEKYASIKHASKKIGRTVEAIRNQANKPIATPYFGYFIRYDNSV